MKKVWTLLLLIAATVGSLLPLHAQEENPVQWSYSVTPTDESKGEYKVCFTATITPPWHLYDLGPYEGGPNATTFIFTQNEALERIGTPVELTPSHDYFDEMFGMEIGTFSTKAEFAQKVQLTDPAQGVELQVTIEWMACDDSNCLPPAEVDLYIPVGDISAATTTSVQSATTSGSDSSSLWATIIEAILWGFAALLTPCVFPMVPMTVSFFIKGSDNKRKGRFMAMLYGLCIVLLYTLPIAIIILVTQLLGGESVTADIFNWLATHWIPNVLFFVIFMLFAASFFGAFEITLPSWMVNKSDQKADKGGLIGLFFMALTLVLVSFSCTGPIVGSVLIKSTSGEVWTPVLTMLAFSAAFALPFTLCALFPTLLKSLPKSGGWLNSVKVVLGFLELALGLKFLSVADQTYHWGILDREIYLALWIAIFSLLTLYLLGKIRFAHDSETKHLSVPRLLLSVITLSFVIYMLPGMWGAPLKGLSGYLPPLHTQNFVLGGESTTHHTTPTTSASDAPKYSDFLALPHGLSGFFDLTEAEAYAKSVGKPLFVDYTGHGCVNCREMEARIWSDPQVLELLRSEFVIVALYSDDKKELPKGDWITTTKGKTLKTMGKINAYTAHQRFGINSQPYYLILNDEGKPLSDGLGYTKSIERFVEFLEQGVDRYRTL